MSRITVACLDMAGTTVHDDGISDHLEGHGGLDWFFALLAGSNQDKIDGFISGDIEVAFH